MHSTKHLRGKQIQPLIFLYKEFLYYIQCWDCIQPPCWLMIIDDQRGIISCYIQDYTGLSLVFEDLGMGAS